MAQEHVRKVAFCPHCSNRAHHRLVHEQYYHEKDTFVDSKGKEEEHTIPGAYFVAVCETCGNVLLYHAYGHVPEPKEFTLCALEYPKVGFWFGSVPKAVSGFYEEALKVKHHSPSSFAVQIGRALEAMCEERGFKKRTLNESLRAMSDKGLIPAVLGEMTEVLRVIRNEGAHAGGKVETYHVWAIDEFFRAIIEYVYVAPSRLARFKDSMERMKQKKVPSKEENGVA